MTGILFRDGPPDCFSHEVTYAIVIVFWAAGTGLLAYVAGKPCVSVTVEPNRAVSIVWRYPFKTVRREVPFSDIGPAAVVETCDDEGAPYYHARVALPDGAAVDISEGHDRARCEAVCTRFNTALRNRA